MKHDSTGMRPSTSAIAPTSWWATSAADASSGGM